MSVIIPCYNEEHYIGACLESVLTNDYPAGQLEILVVDGASTDRTRTIVSAFAARHQNVRLLRNPHRATPRSLNVGIAEARGAVIMRLDAHSTYAPQYVRTCVEGLQRYGADNVGGVWRIVPTSGGLIATAVATALGHAFGAGNAVYRLRPGAAREVDTVPFGCYRRDVFDRIGMFDENLRRGQDMEFNVRLRAAGGRIVLLPDAVCYYHPRSSLVPFVRHSLVNGVWVFYPMRYGRIAFGRRHLVPGLFVAALIGSAAVGAWWPPALLVTAGIGGTYALTSLAVSFSCAWRQRRPGLVWALPLVFACLHVAYGLGTLAGLVRTITTRGFWHALRGARGRRPT